MPCAKPLDDIVRHEQERWGNDETEGLGSFEVNHELELYPLLYRQLSGFSPLQNLVDVCGTTTRSPPSFRSIGHETALVNERPKD
jgi:hypothetical protein